VFAKQSTLAATIKTTFAEEINELGGKVSDVFDDGRLLFLRAILPEAEEVGPKDPVQGGVALRAQQGEAWVHPYLFRQVCKNGAITAQSLEGRHVLGLDLPDPEIVWPELREAIQACASPDAFEFGVTRMRSAQQAACDMALMLVPTLRHLPQSIASQILRQFVGSGDRSMFGMVNAITATARETRDPQLRWDLEELGGGVLAGLDPSPPNRDLAAARRPAFALER
jgi:hypothetical protein